MNTILTVRFMEGDIVEQLFMLKVSALTNNDQPALWRITEALIELVLSSARTQDEERWPAGYVSETRLFGVPVDFVREMPHLLCDNYMIYPYTPPRTQIVMPH
jgi:hypothetical protein